jgi:hypothetical protein
MAWQDSFCTMIPFILAVAVSTTLALYMLFWYRQPLSVVEGFATMAWHREK